MDTIINKITDIKVWNNYLEFKKNQASISSLELKELEEYILNKKYLFTAEKIVNDDYVFSIPEKHLINKINKSKKRVVYTFNQDETMILKLITFLFSEKYDTKYSDNCYSFRRNYGVKEAIKKLRKTKSINSLCGYKIDISNYFNTIDISILLKKLKLFLNREDDKLYTLIEKILTDEKALFNGKIIKEEKGIMAGVPISSFLANIYLKDLDEYFKSENVIYVRYSDDIIFFTDENNISKYIQKLEDIISKHKLNLNKEKITYITPRNKVGLLRF